MLKKNILKRLFIFIVFILASIYLFQSPIKLFIREAIPENTYLRLSWIKSILTGKDFGFYKYEIKLGDQYVDIYDYINNNEFEFSIKATKENNSTIFKIPPFFPAISVDEINTSYIDIINDKLIYATKNGIFFIVQITQNKLNFSPLKSNISSFLKKKFEEKNASINYFNPYTVSKFGIKDILIDQNIIYVSYIKNYKEGSYNTSILKAEISDSIVFEEFFSPRNVISSKNTEFSPIQSGGRIVNYKKDSLLFSVGDYRDRQSAQNLELDNGKILAINKKDSGWRIVSYGHRNPQGLDYSQKFDYILSTEHGPAGGDEINFNKITDGKKNFGWPISSYGVHYSIENARTDSHGGDSLRVVKNAPLYKSHSDYGFIEPIKFFKKNPAVSEIRLIKENKNYNEFILSTLGYDTIQRPMARHLLHYKYDIANDSIQLIAKYSVNERIRDLAFDKKLNKIYYVGESTGVIGELSLD